MDDYNGQGGGEQSAMMYAQMMQESVARWELDVSEIHERIYNYLIGSRMDYKEGVWIPPPDGQKRVSDEGVNVIMGVLYEFVNQSTFLSNLSPSKVANLTIQFGDTLADALTANAKKWRIPKSLLDSIVRPITSQVNMALSRAMNQGERLYRGGYMSFQGGERVGSAENKSGGWFAKLLGRKKEPELIGEGGVM